MKERANCFVDKYVEYASTLTDAPKFFHKIVGWGILSTVVGNKVWVPFGDIRIFPNLWTVLIGGSSFTRKSTSVNIGKRLVANLDNQLLLPSEFTHEKLLAILAKNPRGLFTWYEFSSILGLMSKDYMSGTKSTLTDLYDGFSFERKTMSDTLIIQDPCITIIAATTVEWFLSAIKEGDLRGGFLARFLYVPAGDKNGWLAIPPKADKHMQELLRKTMVDIQAIKGEVAISKKATSIYSNWLQDFEEKGRSHPLGEMGFFSRMGIAALKFATLMELSENRSLNIREAAMERACKMVHYLSAKLDDLFENEMTFSVFSRKLKKVKRFIHKNPGVTKSMLLQNTGLSKRDLEEVLDTLVESETIKNKDEPTKGRPRRCYYPVIPK